MKFGYYVVFSFLTLFTPLAFGASEPWGLLIFNFVCLAFSGFILFHRREFSYTPLSKVILCLLSFIVLLAFLQLINQHNFLDTPAYLPFTLCRYYTLEGLSLLFSLSMLYFALTQIVSHGKEIKNLILINTVSAVLVTLISIGFGADYIYAFTDITLHASFGPFTSRNHGAQYVMMSFFLSLFLWLPHLVLVKEQRLPKKNIVYLALSIVLLAGVFFTHSRGGLMALLLGLLVLCSLCFLFFIKTSAKKIIALTLSAFVFMVLVHLTITFSTSLGLRQFWGGSDVARMALYGAAIDMLKDFPLTGVGFDAFSGAIDAYIPFALKSFPRYLHNDWLELLLSFGYVFGAVIFAFIGVIIVRVISLFKNLSPKKQIRLFILCAGLSGFTFTGIVDFPFHLPACAMLFFFALAFVSANTFDKRDKTFNFPLILKIVPVCLAGFLLWQNFQYVRAWRNFVFVKQFAPKIQAQELDKSLEYYPSLTYIRRTLDGKYKMFQSKSISDEERDVIKAEIHYLSSKYLEQYPKDSILSRLFVLTK